MCSYIVLNSGTFYFRFFPLAGIDYVPLSDVQVVFLPGEFTQAITLFTISDGIVEEDKHLLANLTADDSRVTVFAPVANVIITEDGTYAHTSFYACSSTFSLQRFPSNLATLLWVKEMV